MLKGKYIIILSDGTRYAGEVVAETPSHILVQYTERPTGTVLRVFSIEAITTPMQDEESLGALVFHSQIEMDAWWEWFTSPATEAEALQEAFESKAA